MKVEIFPSGSVAMTEGAFLYVYMFRKWYPLLQNEFWVWSRGGGGIKTFTQPPIEWFIIVKVLVFIT